MLDYSLFASDVATYYSTVYKIIVVTYVDDCLFVGPFVTKIKVLKVQLG